MQRFIICLSVCLASLLSCISINVQAQTVERTTVTTTTVPSSPPAAVATSSTIEPVTIVTPVPAPKETIATPKGYLKCFTVPSKWHHHTWIAEHRVCQYSNFPRGRIWVDGYWICTQHTQGTCVVWKWKSGHWK